MSNDFFDSTINLQARTRARAEPINALSQQVEAAFDLLPSAATLDKTIAPTVSAGGSANILTVANVAPITAYALGQRVSLLATATNTGAATVNVDGLGAKAIVRGDGNALTAGDITTGRIVDLVYDGTQFRIQGTITTIDQAGVDIVIAAATAAKDDAEDAATAAEAAQAAAEAAIAPYTPSDVLAKLVTVDGTGSGLDADLVRGTTPSATGLSLLSAASSTAARGTLELSNVDNTSDASKPVSTATQTALDLKAPIANPVFTGNVTLPGAPTADNHATTKLWVEQAIDGLVNIQAKDAVACVAVSNITLSGEQTIDGVLTSASRVLVAGQTTASQNGIYVSAAGAWTRSTDADTWAELENASVLVTGGTVYSGSLWQAVLAAGGTLGSTDVDLVQRSSADSYTSSGGITKTGLNFALSAMAANTLKGNNTGGSAAPADLTVTQVTAMLNTFGAAKGLVPGVTSNGTQYLRDDGTWTSALTPASLAASGTVTGSNLSGTNTGDQTITLTGDVTGSGTGSFSTAIADNAVSLAKMAQVATKRYLGRTSASTGNVEALTAAQLKADLDLSGTNTGDQTSVTGNAGTATALQTARTIALSGGATGTATSFNGTANITISVTALDLSFASGTLPVNRGGTGTTTSTGTGSVVLSASPTFTGSVGFADGAISSPSIRFASDTNTGFYLAAFDTLGIAVGGVSGGTINSDGLTIASVRAGDGTAASPGFTFSGDTNTGIFRVGADQLGIATGGTLRVTVSTTAVTSTLPALLPDGTVSAPAYSFASDTDTGIFRDGVGVGVAVNGASAAYFGPTTANVAGSFTCGSIRINTAPSTATAVASTHKVAVNINGTTYYLLMTNVP